MKRKFLFNLQGLPIQNKIFVRVLNLSLNRVNERRYEFGDANGAESWVCAKIPHDGAIKKDCVPKVISFKDSQLSVSHSFWCQSWCYQEGLCAQGDFFQRLAIKCFTFILVPIMVLSRRIVCLEVMFLWVIRLKLLRIGYSRKFEIFLFPLISFFLEGGTYLVCASSGEQGLQGWKYLLKILNRQNNRAATALSAFAMIGMAATQGKG